MVPLVFKLFSSETFTLCCVRPCPYHQGANYALWYAVSDGQAPPTFTLPSTTVAFDDPTLSLNSFSVFSADIDRDGDMDVAVCAVRDVTSERLGWEENLNCVANTYSVNVSAAPCAPCPPGTAGRNSFGLASPACAGVCALGRYSDAAGSVDCSLCPGGRFGALPGAREKKADVAVPSWSVCYYCAAWPGVTLPSVLFLLSFAVCQSLYVYVYVSDFVSLPLSS